VWDAHSHDLIDEFRGHTDNIFGLAYSPDGGRVVTGSHDRTLRIWDMTSGEPIALLGATGYHDIPPTDRYLEYLWVSPISRKSGVASRLIQAMLNRLSANGAAAVRLWILDGNTPARQLYEKFGFVSTGEREQLPDGRCEEKMKLILR
jgi:ribosomal protein S18 acetylase RimI-like enzyme